MALSNWDTLSFTMTGPSLDGMATNHENCTLEIYKNWVVVSQPEATVRPKWWPKPEGTVMEDVARIQHGQLAVGHWQIEARRGPQGGVYLVAASARWHDGDYHDNTLLVGCGVYGYSEPGEEYRRIAEEAGFDPDTLMTSSSTNGDTRQLVGLRDDELVVVADNIPASEWVGVHPDSVDYLKALVEEVADEGGWAVDTLRNLPWDQAERCNQGDRYFGANGVNVPGATAPGEAESPFLELVYKNLPRDDG